jgi:hypothetical protein
MSNRRLTVRRSHLFLVLLALASVCASSAKAAPTPTPFSMEIGCTIPLTDYICNKTSVASKTRRFVIETVSFSGQATNGQTVAADFNYKQGGKLVFMWIPVTSFGPAASAGTGVFANTFRVVLRVDAGSKIALEVTRNTSVNAGQNTPYSQRLNLVGYLE